MALAEGVKRCRFCGADIDAGFWTQEPAPRPASESGGGMFADPGPNANSKLTPLPWGASGSGATPLPPIEGRRPHSHVSPLPGTPEAGGRLAPLSFEAANELAKRGTGGSSPAITAPPPPPPKTPALQANLRVVGLVALAALIIILTLMLRGAGDQKAEAGSPAAVCAENCEKESKNSPDSQLDPQGFMSTCMSECLRPAPEKKTR